MKAQDLRIGNKILSDGCVVTVDAIGEYMTVITQQGNKITAHYDLCSGIPLTPSLLEKAGFIRERRWDTGNDPFYVWYFDGVDIHEGNSTTEFLYATYVKGAERSFKAGIAVTTVHHLQNIIHALTGEELQITF